MPHYPTLYLLPKSAKAVGEAYPWVYASDVKESSVLATLQPGELVALNDERGTALGLAYVEPNAKLLARVISRKADAVIDAAFFLRAITGAAKRREKLSYGNYLRLVHAESDYLPGLTIDRFGDVFVCEAFTTGIQLMLPYICEALEKLYAPKTIIHRHEKAVGLVKGTVEDPVTIEEYGVQFLANLTTGQKSGWYYDQRENRHSFAKLANGKTVLDAFCYTGGFGIAAAASNASEVTFMDRSEEALDLAKQSMKAYPISAKFVCGKAFEELEELVSQGKEYDLVSLDPPPFIKSKKDKASGIKGYAKCAALGLRLTKPQGMFMFASCSHHMGKNDLKQVLQKEAEKLGRKITLKTYSGAAPDHPVHPLLQQTEYLHAWLVEVN